MPNIEKNPIVLYHTVVWKVFGVAFSLFSGLIYKLLPNWLCANFQSCIVRLCFQKNLLWGEKTLSYWCIRLGWYSLYILQPRLDISTASEHKVKTHEIVATWDTFIFLPTHNSYIFQLTLSLFNLFRFFFFWYLFYLLLFTVSEHTVRIWVCLNCRQRCWYPARLGYYTRR